MPPAQWVLDAAYTAESAQSFSSGPASPQRHRRAHGVLHFDLRGVTAGPPGPGAGAGSSPSQAPPPASSSAAQWRPASTFKPTGGTAGGAPDSLSQQQQQQHYSALLMSVLSGGAGQPGPQASTPGQAARPPGQSIMSSGAIGRGAGQTPTTDGGAAQRSRQLAVRATHMGGGGFTASRISAGPAAAASMSAGGAGTGGGGGATTAAAARQLTYNPLLPRQGSASAGRRRPSMESGPSMEPSYTASPVGAPSPPWSTAAQRRTTANGAAAQNLPHSSSPSAGGAATAAAVEVLARRAAAIHSTVQAAAAAQKQQQQQVTQGHGCHPEDLVTVAATPMEGRSPRGGVVGVAGGGGVEAMLGCLSGTGLGLGAGPGRSRSRFEPAAAGDGATLQAAGSKLDAAMSAPPAATTTTAALTQHAHHQQYHYLAPSVSMQAALAVLGMSAPLQQAPSAAAAAPAAAPPPPSTGAAAAAGGRRDGTAGAGRAAPPPRSSSSASSTGPPARVHSPIPAIHAVHSSFSGTEDSALEYFGLYEGDALSVAEGEEGGEEDDRGEEDDGEGEGEEGEGEEGRGRRGDDARLHRMRSARGVRSTASVHAARLAAAVGPPAPAPAPATAARGRVAAAAGQHTPPPWTLQRPPSGAAGRPPAAPLPPSASAPARRRSSLDAAAAAAAAAIAAVYGNASVCSREGSASEAGSRPGTASSAWSGYDMLVPPELRLPPGRGRSADSLLSGAGGGGGGGGGGDARTHTGTESGAGKSAAGGGAAASTAAAARRRAASNPRDAQTLDARRSVGGKARGGGGESLSRCSSASSRRAAAAAASGGGGGGVTASQAMALLASLALTSPPSPSAASVSSAGGAAGRKRVPSAARGGGRKAAASGGGGGGPPPHRPLHPAVLALTDVAAAAAGAPSPPPSDRIPTDDKGRPFPYLLPPAFPGTCPTIAFVGSAAEKAARGLAPLLAPTLYVKYGGVANTPVRTAFREAGLRPTRKGKRWSVQWGGILDAAALAKLHSFQRVNHFPGTWELGHKGHLYRNVYSARRRARGPAAEAFDIVPRFYIMPRDYEEFRADCERYPDRMYIQKPTNSSRGRGIRMVTRPEAISRDAKDVLVQHYIANPLLLNGFKFDMRVYAAATCLDPLRLYVFPDGLARLATEPYSADKADLSKRCVHLTNYSVNKKSDKSAKQQQQQGQAGQQQGQGGQQGQQDGAAGGEAAGSAGGSGPGSAPQHPHPHPHPQHPQQQQAAARGSSSCSSGGPPVDPASECEGYKWSLSGLKHYLEARGLGPGWLAVWRQVCDIVAAAVIAAEPRMNTEFKMKVPHRNNCFEVWGFDIMLTDSFRAWLIEANTCPSLAADSGLDMRVKGAMVSELMHMLGPVPYDVEVYEKAAEARRQARLTGLPVASPAVTSTRAAAPSGGGGGGGGDPDDAPPTPSLGAQQSFGLSSSISGSTSGSGVVQPKSLHELYSIDLSALSPAELPEVVLEAEAELARKGSWQRVFPCEEEPTRYLNLFETPRLNNVLLCKYYLQTGGGRAAGGGGGGGGPGDVFRRPNSVSRGGARGTLGGLGTSGGVGGGGGRPQSREWRPGGGGGG
ncbi:Tubulin polyglutamylase ttll5 [Pleodorina starrii]|uniref:Tubulin--tyrosine ligase-like protein 9 n=1 Tax=Pleodorina starrii TaxID=330485 RepID=A0A9W6F1U6_9CHLO|nr:Tubulin polyglutamylase ttll5 [Pleodorina starrii]GLC53548.1 Tubulin polyglutamylase ttll5 [Pleodorina starrii]